MKSIEEAVEELSWNLRKDIKIICGVYDTVITDKLEKALTTTLTTFVQKAKEEERERIEKKNTNAVAILTSLKIMESSLIPEGELWISKKDKSSLSNTPKT